MTKQPTGPTLFTERLTMARLDRVRDNLAVLPKLSHAQWERKPKILETLDDLIETCPWTIDESGAFRERLRQSVAQFRAEQAAERERGHFGHPAKAQFRSMVTGMIKELRDRSKRAAQEAMPDRLIEALEQDGADHPTLRRFNNLRDFALSVPQMKAWEHYGTQLRAHFDELLALRPEQETEREEVLARVREIGMRFADRTDVATRNAVVRDKITDMINDPTLETIGDVVHECSWHTKAFNDGYWKLIRSSYARDSEDIQRHQGATSAMNEPHGRHAARGELDPRNLDSRVLDCVYTARWGGNAAMVANWLERHALTLSDSSVELQKRGKGR